MGELTHFNKQGRARMVDVTEKAVTHRRAVAAGEIPKSRHQSYARLYAEAKAIPDWERKEEKRK